MLDARMRIQPLQAQRKRGDRCGPPDLHLYLASMLLVLGQHLTHADNPSCARQLEMPETAGTPSSAISASRSKLAWDSRVMNPPPWL
jgi:hypothetical protein